jgi:hypothetical protein
MEVFVLHQILAIALVQDSLVMFVMLMLMNVSPVHVIHLPTAQMLLVHSHAVLVLWDIVEMELVDVILFVSHHVKMEEDALSQIHVNVLQESMEKDANLMVKTVITLFLLFAV